MIVKVIWEDIDYWNDWVLPSEVIEHRDCLITTYGKILYEDERRVIVACEEHSDGKRYARVTRIPRAMIKSIEKLGE